MREDRCRSTGRDKPSFHASNEPAARRSILPADRGISDVIGYVLVVSLVLSVVGIVTVSGFTSLEDARDVEQTNNAERAFDVLSDNIADVYEHGAPSRATEISLTEASLHTSSSVTLNVSANDTNSDDNITFQVSTRPIVWEGSRGTEIAYSYGAIIRDEGDGGVVIDQAPLQLDPDRTVIHIVQLRSREGESFGGGTVRVRAVRASSTVFVSEQTDKYDVVWLNLTTPRASAWQQYYDQYPETSCHLEENAGSETAACKLTNRNELHVTLTRIGVEIEG